MEDPAALEDMIKMRKTGMCEFCREKKDTEILPDDWGAGMVVDVEVCADCVREIEGP